MKNFSIKLKIKNSILILALVTALILSGFKVQACYGLGDMYAVEVVLNKQGVNYDLSKLAGIDGVVAVDYFGAYSAYVYRSHYDNRLIVVVSEQGLKYANINVPANEPSAVIIVSGLDIDPKQVSDGVEKARGELGWKIETLPVLSSKDIGFIFSKTINNAEVRVFLLGILDLTEGKGYKVKLGLSVKGVKEIDDVLASKIKLEIGNLLDKIELSQLKKLMNTNFIKNALFEKLPEQEKYITVRIQIPLKQEVKTITMYVCNINEKFNLSELKVEDARKLGWSVSVRKAPEDNHLGFVLVKNIEDAKLCVEGKGRGDGSYLSLKVEGARDLSDIIKNEFKKVFESIGLNKDIVEKCNFQRFESKESRIVPAYNFDKKEIRNALRAELEWLSKNGIISGLSKDDIEAIVSAAKLGYAGWNNRLVWFNGKWTSYSYTDGATVLRCSRALPSFFLKEEITTKPPNESLYSKTIHLAISIVAALMVGTVAYLVVRRSIPVEK